LGYGFSEGQLERQKKDSIAIFEDNHGILERQWHMTLDTSVLNSLYRP